jgi:hypothetical protein
VQLRRLVIASSLALFAACKSDSNAPTGLNGTVSFSYTAGGASSTFNVTGAVPTGNVMTTTWTVGAISASEGGTFIEAATPASASTHNFAFIFLPRTTAGSSTIDDPANCSPGALCAEVFLELGAPNAGLELPAQTCLLEVGTITITEITSTRIRGTFTGTGTCTSSANVNSSFTVTNGTFDVALAGNVP